MYPLQRPSHASQWDNPLSLGFLTVRPSDEGLIHRNYLLLTEEAITDAMTFIPSLSSTLCKNQIRWQSSRYQYF